MKTLLVFASGAFTCLILSLTFAQNEEPELVTHTDMSSLLFKNCCNNLTFGLPKGANAEYSCTNGRVIRTPDNDRITLVPTSDSAVTLTIKCNGKTYKQQYKSIPVPTPTVEILNSENRRVDLKIGVAAPGPNELIINIKASSFFSSIYPRDSKFFLSEALVILVRGKRPVAQLRVSTGQVDLSAMTPNVQPGDRILVEAYEVSRANFVGTTEVIPFTSALINIPIY